MVLLRQINKASDTWDIAIGLEYVFFPFWLGKRIRNTLYLCKKGNTHLQFSFRAKLTHLSPTFAAPAYLLHRTSSRSQRKFEVGLQIIGSVCRCKNEQGLHCSHIPGWLKAVEREQFSNGWSTEQWTWHCLRWEYTQVTGQSPRRERTGWLDQVVLGKGHVAGQIRVGTVGGDVCITHACPPESTSPPQKRRQITKQTKMTWPVGQLCHQPPRTCMTGPWRVAKMAQTDYRWVQ